MTISKSRRDVVTRTAMAGAALALGLGAHPPAHAAASRYGILGRSAPEIEGSHWIDLDGEPIDFDMRSLANRWIYLKCFQSWCPGCHKHGFPTLKKVVDAFSGEERFVAVGLQTVFEGFGINTVDKVREIQLQYELPITMGHDAGDPAADHRPVTMRRYRTGGTPWVVIINPVGQVVYNDYHISAERFIDYLKTQLA